MTWLSDALCELFCLHTLAELAALVAVLAASGVATIAVGG